MFLNFFQEEKIVLTRKKELLPVIALTVDMISISGLKIHEILVLIVYSSDDLKSSDESIAFNHSSIDLESDSKFIAELFLISAC